MEAHRSQRNGAGDVVAAIVRMCGNAAIKRKDPGSNGRVVGSSFLKTITGDGTYLSVSVGV